MGVTKFSGCVRVVFISVEHGSELPRILGYIQIDRDSRLPTYVFARRELSRIAQILWHLHTKVFDFLMRFAEVGEQT